MNSINYVIDYKYPIHNKYIVSELSGHALIIFILLNKINEIL